jgi:hypothetical protein
MTRGGGVLVVSIDRPLIRQHFRAPAVGVLGLDY